MKKVSIILFCIIAMVAFAMGVDEAEARSSFWAGQGGCADCHVNDSTTCAGCHAHGVHSTNVKIDINVIASTDKATYSPGEMVTVSITGGYRPGWVRAILYDENGVEVDRDSGPCNDSAADDMGCGDNGGTVTSVFPGPILLTAPAPSVAGTYEWEASWYGNEYDLGNIGGTTFFGNGWIPDPNNPTHGEEVVFVNAFDVVAAAECGDGVIDTGEDCDDGVANGTTICGCQIDCTYTAPGTGCGDQGVECLVEDTCDGAGACTDNGFQDDGSACGDPSSSECDNADTCLGGTCQDNIVPAGNACGDQGIDCLVDDSCDGAGACTDNGLEADGTACGDPSSTQCDNPDSCTAGACEPNNEPAGVICEDGEFCTDGDACNGTGMCMGGVDTPCQPGETCDEVNNICVLPPGDCGNGVLDTGEDCDDGAANGTTECGCQTDCTYTPVDAPCGDQGVECLADDTCDGVGACTDNGNQPDGSVCGDASDTQCDNPDSCLAGACEPNNEPAGVICEDGEFCTDGDACNGTGMCMGGVDSPCQPGETCDEVNNICVLPPGDCGNGVLDTGEDCDDGAENGTTECGCQTDCAYTPVDAPCGDQGVECLVDDSCDGVGACTDNGNQPDGSVCGDASDTQCDNPDSCLAGSCDPNNEPAGVICEDGEFCTDGDACNGTGMCMGGVDTPCQPGETCDEANDMCVEGQIDLDIARFAVSKSVRLEKIKPVTIKLVVKNNGTENSQTRPATVTGMQNGDQVFMETQDVSDAVGNGRSTFNFGPYTPTAVGDIMWTVIIDDDNNDDDIATAVTEVK